MIEINNLQVVFDNTLKALDNIFKETKMHRNYW